jgi:hypothetical protein
MMAVARWPARSEPANNQIDLFGEIDILGETVCSLERTPAANVLLLFAVSLVLQDSTAPILRPVCATCSHASQTTRSTASTNSHRGLSPISYAPQSETQWHYQVSLFQETFANVEEVAVPSVNRKEVAGELSGADDLLETQVEPKKGVFPDDDGLIPRALDEARDASRPYMPACKAEQVGQDVPA